MTMRTDPDAQAMQAAERQRYKLLIDKLNLGHEEPANRHDAAAMKEAATVLAELVDELATLRSRLAEGGEPVASFQQVEKFLAASLKPDEISGNKRMERIDELLHWFARYLDGAANPKWFRDHTYELCYFIATLPLYRTPPTHTAAVQAALEAAAKVCEEFSGREHDPWDYAAAIRALTPQDVLGGGHE